MTVAQMIAKFDTMYPNEFTSAEKEDWLNECDFLCYKEIMSHYEGVPEFDGHSTQTEELLIGTPYDRLYESYLATKMYLAREEIDRYNNFADKFAEEYKEWGNFLNRTNTIKQKAVKFF